MIRTRPITALLLGALLTAGIIALIPEYASTESVTDLQRQIDERSRQIQELEEEIARYRSQADAVGREVRNLENALGELTASRNALEAEMALARSKLNNTRTRLTEIHENISEIEMLMEEHRNLLAQSIRELDTLDRSPLLLLFFSQDTISDVWHEVMTIQQLQDIVTAKVADLADLNHDLVSKRSEEEAEQRNLIVLQQELEGRQSAIQYTIEERDAILGMTRSEEEQYRRLLAERQRQKREFEQELFQFESQLRQRIDPTQIPSPRPGLLSAPLDSIFVTQQFGITAASGRLYASGSHSGVDFRASIGTPVHSAQSGVVKGVGNTDSVPGCYSYGKWVLIEHANGLSSMYAHLSVISVQEGQTVDNRQVIGYSGNTGFSTGPHLHMEVYASNGVGVQQYSSSINCKAARIPLTTKQGARLDPMSYLPTF